MHSLVCQRKIIMIIKRVIKSTATTEYFVMCCIKSVYEIINLFKLVRFDSR